MKKIKYIVLIAGLVSFLTGHAQKNSITWSTSLPLGKSADFISKYSLRGIGYDARWEVGMNNFYMGVGGSWNVFYESASGTFVEEDGTRTLTGNIYRYINSFNLFMESYKYIPKDDIDFYLGGGIGPQYIENVTNAGLWSITDKGWQFGLAPEIGFIYNINYNNGILFNLKYHYAFETKSNPAFSALGINLGLTF